MSAKVFLHIERLVLRDVDPAHREAVARALQDALGEGLMSSDAAARLVRIGHAASLRVPAVKMRAEAQPRTLGRAVGESIARSLGK